MKRIIYVMNVEWNWIKQRPHFIAEYLSEDFEVYIVYQYRYKRKGLQKRNEKRLQLIPIKVIPKISAYAKLRRINEYIMACKVKKMIKRLQPCCLYLTFPTQLNIIPTSFDGKVIYDCMDNHSAFCVNEKERKNLEYKEKELIQKSNVTLVSSEYLREIISSRYSVEKSNFELIRNAYDGIILENVKNKPVSPTFKMGYVGTISAWFDWDTIINVLNNSSDTELHLYGPIDKATKIPNDSRIYYHGTIEHSEIYNAIKDMNCLIMPFIINDIIRAVDPVKIYEYINFNKDIILCRYNEVDRFEPFVYFYDTVEDFIRAIKEINNNKHVKYTNRQRIQFLKENDWHTRVEQIEKLIEH